MSSPELYLLGLATPFLIVGLCLLASRLIGRLRRVVKAGKFPAPLFWRNLTQLLGRLEKIGWDMDLYGFGLGRFGVGVFVGTKRKRPPRGVKVRGGRLRGDHAAP